MYYGTFAKKVKVSGGCFDGESATGNSKLLGAARVQIDFWDQEDGYYLNGTYYGDKNLLAIGGATQFQDGRTATTADFLSKRNWPAPAFRSKRVFQLQRAGRLQRGLFQKPRSLWACKLPLSQGAGPGLVRGLSPASLRRQFLPGTTPSFAQKTTEVNFNYVIKQFNARVMSFYQIERFNRVMPNLWQVGLGLQIQM